MVYDYSKGRNRSFIRPRLYTGFYRYMRGAGEEKKRVDDVFDKDVLYRVFAFSILKLYDRVHPPFHVVQIGRVEAYC